MPLPSGDMQWPPKALVDITPKLNEWAAWYQGDGDTLTRIYAGHTGQTPLNRPSQYRGGLVGALSRMFWGQPTPDGQARSKLHVPVAADIATASSDLLFSEQVTLNLPDGTTDDQRARFDRLLEGNGWSSLLVEAAEECAALGGSFLRVTWDQAVADHALVTSVAADSAWPEFLWGRLTAVTFWKVVRTDGTQIWRHLERHEAGGIEHGLFQGTSGNLGTRVPLTEAAATADLTVDADSRVPTGYPGLTASYVPNMRPNRRWRNNPVGAHLGRSDFDGVEPLMDAFDEVYSSWMRDIRTGKSRIIVPEYMLDDNGPGKGASFDLDQEVFTTVNVPPSEGGNDKITPQQFQIRVKEHADTASDLLIQILRSAGYSAQTFGADNSSAAMTATEIQSRDRRSLTTREKKTRYWSHAIGNILQALTAVDTTVFGSRIGEIRPVVEFPPAVQPTVTELAQSAQALRAAQAASTKTLVESVHPDWDRTRVDDEVEAIHQEQGVPVDDPASLHVGA